MKFLGEEYLILFLYLLILICGGLFPHMFKYFYCEFVFTVVDSIHLNLEHVLGQTHVTNY